MKQPTMVEQVSKISSNKKKISNHHITRHLFSYTVLLVYSAIALIPFIWALLGSFKNTSEIFAGGLSFIPKIWRWSNYPEAWQTANMGAYFFNSIFTTVFTVLLLIMVCSLAGYSFAKLRLSRISYLFYIYLIGLTIPVQATVLSVFLLLRSFGLHNTRLGYILALTGTGIPFSTFLMRNFFKNMSNSLGESAELDGASPLTIFLCIYFPLAKPALLAVVIFSFLYAWNMFYLALIVLTDDKLWTIPLAVNSFDMLNYVNYGYSFAAAIISVIPTIILYLIFQRSFVKGITAGAMKS